MEKEINDRSSTLVELSNLLIEKAKALDIELEDLKGDMVVARDDISTLTKELLEKKKRLSRLVI